MLLEYLDEGDALSHIQKTGAVSEALARSWLVQITGAVRYMHDRNVSHRDLKLENLLLTDHGMTIKLCDFGFVKEVANSEELSQTFCGSKAYAAPEILKGQPYDPKKGDIWAMGVITYILVTGKMPFDESRGTKRVLEDQAALHLQWNRDVRITSKCHQLILRMLTWNFTERPTITRVQRDEWFASESPSPLAGLNGALGFRF
jgi:serine kinase